MQIFLHQTHHDLADFEAFYEYISNYFDNNAKKGLHLFPELFLTGYPLQDLVLRKTFIEAYLELIKKINLWSKKNAHLTETSLLLGGLNYHLDSMGQPTEIENVIFELTPGKNLKVVHVKELLPTYDIYEEKKYFTPGNEASIVEILGKNIALLICEDMWFSHLHDIDPVAQLIEQQKTKSIDLIVNLSASPYYLNKIERRLKRAEVLSLTLKAPIAYLNRVGLEDEILFDGMSFYLNGPDVEILMDPFVADVKSLTYTPYRPNKVKIDAPSVSSSWDEMFANRLSPNKLELQTLKKEECLEIIKAQTFAIYEYARKHRIHKFTLALSGGIDSCLVLTLLYLMRERYKSIDQKKIEIEAIYMPGLYSSTQSYDLSFDLCQKLKIKLKNMPIKFIHAAIRNHFKDTFGEELVGLSDENIQSRLRGNFLFSRSNHQGSLVINTSNKSEIAVGYSTMYGDAVGAFSILGDLYKLEVFELAKFINEQFDQLIPEEVIQRAPSAELRENQKDEESLPPYSRLDPILEALLSFKYSQSDIIKFGHDENEVHRTYQLLKNSEYKRKQFCPIIKLKPRSFGFGYKIPICKKTL